MKSPQSISLPDSIIWQEGLTLKEEDVGLRADRPFRFCTLHYGTKPHAPLHFGDDPNPTTTRTLEFSVENHQGKRNVPSHTHQFYEVVLIHSGTVDHIVHGQSTELSRGDIIVIAPGVYHAYARIMQLVKTNLYIQPEWFFDELRMLWWEEGLVRHLLATAMFRLPDEMRWFQLRATPELMERCERELADMRQEAQESTPSLLAFHAGFLKILNTLNRSFKQSFIDFGTPLEESVWRAVQSIETCISQGLVLNVKELASELGISSNHLTRLFSETTGLAPTEFFQARRIQHARRLLLEPRRTITEIAHYLGYADAAHFSRSFK